MTSAIPPEFLQFINDEVASGVYPNPDAVITDALNLLQAEKKHLTTAVRAGIEQLDRGDSIAGDDVFRQLRARIESRIQKSP